MTSLDRALAALAASQCGILTRDQVLVLGYTDDYVRARLEGRQWVRLHPGVLATFTGPLTRQAAIWAAVLYAGAGATLSHHTAAEVHRLIDEVDDDVHVTVPVDRRVRSRRGVRIHYAHRLPVTRDDSRVPAIVNVNDTVLDLVDVSLRPKEAIDWVTRACQRRRTNPQRPRAALTLRKKLRWRATVEAALADVADGAETPLELAYLRKVERAHRLPTGSRQRHHRSGGRSQWIDVEYTDFGLRVELDGRIGHVEDGAFRDRRRDNASAVEGFTTLRFGWVEVYHDACDTAGQVATMLRGRGWRGEPRRCGKSCPPSHDHEGFWVP